MRLSRGELEASKIGRVHSAAGVALLGWLLLAGLSSCGDPGKQQDELDIVAGSGGTDNQGASGAGDGNDTAGASNDQNGTAGSSVAGAGGDSAGASGDSDANRAGVGGSSGATDSVDGGGGFTAEAGSDGADDDASDDDASADDASADDASDDDASDDDANDDDASDDDASDDDASDDDANDDGASDDDANDDDATDDESPVDCDIPDWANSPIGYGAQTTGGGNSSPVVVRSFSEAEGALAAYQDAFKDGAANALVIHYDGRFDFATISDVCAQHEKEAQILSIKEMENVTFLGLPGSSANFGIKINRARNVIVRNMTMGLLPGGGDSDAITIEGNGNNGDVENVWIDHNDLFSSTKDDCDGAGDTEFDGLIDIKKGARYITISYNKLHDHQKTGLLGHSDSDDMDRFVTFHHNWYDNVVSRTPLHRFGYVHLFNNYFHQITSSGINVRMGGVALIEANYFEDVANPITSRYSDEAGFWDLRDNFVGSGITWSTESDTLANAEDWESTASYPDSALTYSYAPDRAECVKAIVMESAGALL